MTRLIKLLNNEPSEHSFLETLQWHAVTSGSVIPTLPKEEVVRQPNSEKIATIIDSQLQQNRGKKEISLKVLLLGGPD